MTGVMSPSPASDALPDPLAPPVGLLAAEGDGVRGAADPWTPARQLEAAGPGHDSWPPRLATPEGHGARPSWDGLHVSGDGQTGW